MSEAEGGKKRLPGFWQTLTFEISESSCHKIVVWSFKPFQPIGLHQAEYCTWLGCLGKKWWNLANMFVALGFFKAKWLPILVSYVPTNVLKVSFRHQLVTIFVSFSPKSKALANVLLSFRVMSHWDWTYQPSVMKKPVLTPCQYHYHSKKALQ